MESFYVGVDWGNEEHQVEVMDAQGEVVWRGRPKTTPAALIKLRDRLLDLVDGQADQLQVSIEDPTRPLVEVLGEVGVGLFAINPKKVDRLRGVYRVSGAKDDVHDAHILANELRLHPQVFFAIEADDPLVAQLREAYRACGERRDQRQESMQKLERHLSRYFPQFLQLDWRLDQRVMLDLLDVVSSPDELADVELDQIRDALGRTRKHTAEQVVEILGGPGVPTNPGTAMGARLRAEEEADNLRRYVTQESRWEKRLKQLLARLADQQRDEQDSEATPSDVAIVLSLPGVGVRNTAGLFADGYHPLLARDIERLRRQSIAPVTHRTGKEKARQQADHQGRNQRVSRRFARSRHLANTLFQIGDCAQRTSGHYRRRYKAMKARGHTHGRACRQIADQLLRVLFAMLRDHTLYDPTLHGATRRQPGKQARLSSASA